jgi:hypothetical protein
MEFDHRFCLYKTPWSTQLAMKTDGKSLFLLSFLYFLAKTGSGSENVSLETESGYVDTRKQTNTDREPEN